MNINLTYPPKRLKKIQRKNLIEWAKWPFIIAAITAPIVNFIIGGPAWSIVALWSLWIVWSFAFSPTLIESNRLSIAVKTILNTSILLLLIDQFLSSGWALKVIAIVVFSGLIITGILFLSDLRKQKQNLLPLLIFIVGGTIFSIVALIIWKEKAHWSIIVMAAVTATLLLTTGIVLRTDLIKELKKRFHV